MPPFLTPHLGLFFWTLLAFLVVLFILRKFAWNPILKTLNERETGIADQIAAAQKVKAEMASLKAENEKLLVQAREERTRILKDAATAGEKIVAEAKEKAQADAAKIVSDAQLLIEQQKNAAIAQVKNEIGNIAIDVAEKIIRRDLSADSAQQQLAQELAGEVKFN